MNTRHLIRKGIMIFLVACMIPTGCQKDADIIRPARDTEKTLPGFSSKAAGDILSCYVNGIYRTGVKLDQSNTVTLKVSVYATGTYHITSNSDNGVSFSAGGIFSNRGTNEVILYGVGTPVEAGTNSFKVSFGYGLTFNVVTVDETPVVQRTGNKSITYRTVANHKTQRIWLDRNLGASRVGLNAADCQAYGSLYQWGRSADGHQLIAWSNAFTGSGMNGIASETMTAGRPGQPMFVKSLNFPWDWCMPQNKMLWQGEKGVNNPCPAGFRIPTEAELEEETESWVSRNASGGFSSPLRWVVAGYREFNDGNVLGAGSSGGVWSATVAGDSRARTLRFTESESNMMTDFRAEGYSVRCIKND